MKYLRLFEDFIVEKKPKGAPDFHHSDAPDAEGRFKDLSIKKLAAWLIKTRNKDNLQFILCLRSKFKLRFFGLLDLYNHKYNDFFDRIQIARFL